MTTSTLDFQVENKASGRLRKNATKRGKGFLQGLKPVESTQFTSALKHRPPEEKDFSRGLLECSAVVMGRLWQVVIVIRHFPRET